MFKFLIHLTMSYVMLRISTFIFHDQSSPNFLLKMKHVFQLKMIPLCTKLLNFHFCFNFRFSILNNNLSDNLCNRLLEWQSCALTSLYLLILLVFSWLVLLFAFSNVIVYHLVQLKREETQSTASLLRLPLLHL